MWHLWDRLCSPERAAPLDENVAEPNASTSKPAQAAQFTDKAPIFHAIAGGRSASSSSVIRPSTVLVLGRLGRIVRGNAKLLGAEV